MIVYATQKTVDRYQLKMPDELSSPLKESVGAVIEREAGDRLLEWGMKLFYFNRRKCLQIANFASKFTLFLVDIKVGDLKHIGTLMAHYMYDIYSDNPEMISLLDRFFNEHSVVVISRLKDKSIIAQLNHSQIYFADDGYRLYDFVEDGYVKGKKINEFFNTQWLVTQMNDGKKEYVYPTEIFEKLLKERYYGK